jgi:hypothetical protein
MTQDCLTQDSGLLDSGQFDHESSDTQLQRLNNEKQPTQNSQLKNKNSEKLQKDIL